MAVWCEQGENEIVLKYTPPGLTLGFWLSFSAILGLALLIVMQNYKKRRALMFHE